MIKEHTPYTIDDAVFDIRSKVSSKPKDFGLSANLPSVDTLMNEDRKCFKASVACVYLNLDSQDDPSQNMFIYETVTSEVKKAMVEDINCIDVLALGNCVYGIFYTPIKESMKLLIDCLAKVHSTLILLANIGSLEDLKYRIAANYGDVYFANYKKDTESADYHWFGKIFDDVLDKAKEQPSDNYVYITNFIRENIIETYQNFFVSEEIPWFKASVVNTIFSNWQDNDTINNK